MHASIPGILLTDGAYYGTLAAARCYGRAGYRVTLADPSSHGPCQASRHVHRTVTCPGRLDFNGVAQWLEAFGQAHPGTLLYPCSDHLLWVVACHHERLQPHFTLLQPRFECIATLLDKRRLYDLCDSLSVPTPHTVYPVDDSQLRHLVSKLRGPYLVKPRTQAGLEVNRKSELALAGPALVEAYRSFRLRFRYVDAMLQYDPEIAWPMLQAFNPSASTQTLSVAGFRSPSGDFFVATCSRKALQYPFTIGTGLCFESVADEPVAIGFVQQLCEEVGYFGAFEVEFIKTEDGFQLMDFNPRFYGQMQLEISRGLPIPLWVLAWAGGISPPPGTTPIPARLSNRSLLKLVMTTQWMAGRVSWSDRRRWLRFVSDPSAMIADHVRDSDDPAPARADWRARIRGYCRHPRSSLRTLFGSE